MQGLALASQLHLLAMVNLPSASAIPLIIYRDRQYSIWVQSFYFKITIPYEHQSSALFAVNTLTVVLDVLSVATDKVNV